MIVACIIVSFAVATVTATFICLIALRSAGATSEYERAWEASPMYTLERKYRHPDHNVGIPAPHLSEGSER